MILVEFFAMTAGFYRTYEGLKLNGSVITSPKSQFLSYL
mgnify:CR=1 FL=1